MDEEKIEKERGKEREKERERKGKEMLKILFQRFL